MFDDALDGALDDQKRAGSGFTAPGVSIHALRPVPTTGAPGAPGSSSAFADAPVTQETKGRPASLPPEFDDGEDDISTGTMTVVDSERRITPSQLQHLRAAEPGLEDRTILSSVPDAVLQHLRREGAGAAPEDDGMVFQQTERWERPTLPSEHRADERSEVGPEDATVVRASPYSSVASDASTPSSEPPVRRR